MSLHRNTICDDVPLQIRQLQQTGQVGDRIDCRLGRCNDVLSDRAVVEGRDTVLGNQLEGGGKIRVLEELAVVQRLTVPRQEQSRCKPSFVMHRESICRGNRRQYQ